eukprot:4930273-Amphidinium_carterae.2
MVIAQLEVLSVDRNNFEGNMSNTLITEYTGGLPRPQHAGRDNSTAVVWRQQVRPTSRGSQSLRVSRMSAASACYANDSKESLSASCAI